MMALVQTLKDSLFYIQKTYGFLNIKSESFRTDHLYEVYTINATAMISITGVMTAPTHNKKDTGRRGRKR